MINIHVNGQILHYMQFRKTKYQGNINTKKYSENLVPFIFKLKLAIHFI